MVLGFEAMIHLLEGLVGTVTIPFEGEEVRAIVPVRLSGDK